MGTTRELLHKNRKSKSPLDKPVWLIQEENSPNRNFITSSEKRLIDLVRNYGEFTKADLITYTDYSRTKITSCIASLLNKKIIVANKATEYSGGRRSKTFSLNGKLGFLAGIDIGATSIDLGIADSSGRILVRYAEPASIKDGPIKVLGRVCSLLEKLLKENSWEPESIIGIGIGVPGPVDFSAGIAVSPPIMPGWDCYPIIPTMQQWFPSANVVVDNDVNVMALGEVNHGGRQAGRQLDLCQNRHWHWRRDYL